MALPAITATEHSRNLYRLSNLPYGEDEIRLIEQELKELIGNYHNLLIDLSQTIEKYKQTAAKIGPVTVKFDTKEIGLPCK